MMRLVRFVSLAVLFAAPALGFAQTSGKHYLMSNGVLNTFFRTTAYSAPANTYVGLFSTCPTTSSLGTELSSNGYTRSAAIAKADASWTLTAATSGNNTSTIVNAASISFPAASGSSWTVNCFGVFSASSAGDLLYWGPVTGAPITVSVGATASFAIGALTLTER